MQGSRTCRRRRVKCDEQHPRCKRCCKAGYECEGYVREHRFVDENPRIERKQARGKDARDRNQETTDTNSLCPTPSSNSTQTDLNTGTRNPNSKFQTSTNLSLGPTLSVVAFEDNILTTFLLANLFSGYTQRKPWLLNHFLDTSSPTVLASTRALSTAYFGRMHRLPLFVSWGSELYVAALRHLNTDLMKIAKYPEVKVLKSARIVRVHRLL